MKSHQITGLARTLVLQEVEATKISRLLTHKEEKVVIPVH
jgi:hypothetical protein